MKQTVTASEEEVCTDCAAVQLTKVLYTAAGAVVVV